MALSRSEIQRRYKRRHPGRAEQCTADWALRHTMYYARYAKQWKTGHRERYMVNKARFRAKEKGVAFDITASDVFIPEVCPVLGIPLRWGCKRKSDNSPSIDCLIPSLGYIRGNIAVISMRANRIKNNATPVELELIARWVRRGVLRAAR